jgi:3-carboxy-cis,cis-muconate cycloisomerase
MVMAGRTHGQHAVPITFGLKVASWIDEIGRHITRMRELEPRLFVAIVGGAAGSFASLGDRRTRSARRRRQKAGTCADARSLPQYC